MWPANVCAINLEKKPRIGLTCFKLIFTYCLQYFPSYLYSISDLNLDYRT